MKGGYAGFGKPDPNARDLGEYESILSGDLASNDGPDFANNGENSYHVVTGSHTNATTVLDSVTITGGNANANWDHWGGGMYINGGSPTFIHCTFRGNWGELGGGMSVSGSNSTLRHCIIERNSAFGKGAGILCVGSNLKIMNCAIRYNATTRVGSGRGGGLWCRASIPVITNTIISENSAGTDGGGIYNDYESDLILTNCRITANVVGWATGGGIANHFDSHPILTNCIVYGNRNSAGTDQSAQLYGNWPVVNFCCIEGWTGTLGGVGNFGNDPLFVDPNHEDPKERDYHLRQGSPCIDTGDLHGAYEGQIDSDGQPRVMGMRVDMGADEYGTESPPVIAVGSTRMELITHVNDCNVLQKTLSIWNNGINKLNWQIIKYGDWLDVNPTYGECSGQVDEVTISIDTENMVPGVEYNGLVLVYDINNPINNPMWVEVRAYRGITRHVPGEYQNIQAAVDSAKDGDVIVVADGNYSGEGNRDIHVSDLAVTIRSANGPETCIIDCGGSSSELHRGFRFEGNTYSNPTLEGFRIVNGYHYYGGGIYSRMTNPTIVNCIICCNKGDSSGGGIMYDESSINISNCIISENIAGMEGGGGIASGASANANIRDSMVYRNSSEGGGGGISCIHSSCRVLRCKIIGNRTEGYGGGIANIHSEPGGIFIDNCLISDNSAGRVGGGIDGCNGAITNCTIVGNGATIGAGISNCKGPVSNCIIWDNNGIEISGGKSNVTYSDIEGGFTGTGNINVNPLFFDSCEGNYHLLLDSPCINTGNPLYVGNTDEIDLDGQTRVMGGRIEMGAYEFNHIPIANAGEDQIVYASQNGIAEVILDGTNSYDDDGHPLTYKWSWTVDSNTYDINGVSPTIELPLGEHIIKLILNDGLDDSEPDQVVITVALPMQSLLIVPQVINRQGDNKTILVLVRLPKGVTKEQVNMEKSLQFFPGGIEALSQRVIGSLRQGVQYTNIYSLFDKDELMLAIPDNGSVELHVVGWLMNGTIFRGRFVIRVIHEVNVRPVKYGKASNPSPADGATFVSMTADLSWTPGSHAISHNVYFGRSSSPPFVCIQTSTTFDPGTMDNNTTYYWRIDEVSKWGITTGDIWSFKTMFSPPPPPFPHPPP
jgi:hypothetical protein